MGPNNNINSICYRNLFCLFLMKQQWQYCGETLVLACGSHFYLVCITKPFTLIQACLVCVLCVFWASIRESHWTPLDGTVHPVSSEFSEALPQRINTKGPRLCFWSASTQKRMLIRGGSVKLFCISIQCVYQNFN